jgi:hypothetical protein
MEEEKKNNTISDKKSINESLPQFTRMDAHDYENKIQELLEKIDILETRLKLMGEQKFRVVSKLKTYENENDILKKQIENEMKEAKLKSFDREKYEKQINDLKNSNKELNEKSQLKFENLNKEIEDKEKKLNQLNDKLKEKDEALRNYNVNNTLSQKHTNEYKNDLELQKNLNNIQREKIIELQKKVDQLFSQKQNEGSLQNQIDHLKDDNNRLITMLKSTNEFKDFAYLGETIPGGIRYIRGNEKKTYQTKKGKNTIQNSQKEILDNQNWVPTEAVEFAEEFKNKYNIDMSENLLNNLLSSLNRIWRLREIKQINRIKNQYQSEIESLRRKLAMKPSYNEFNAKKTISLLRNDLKKTRDDLRDNIVLNNKLKNNPEGIDLVDNALKVAGGFANTKKCLEKEIENLKNQLEEKNEKYPKSHTVYNQGCYYMSKKAYEDIDLLEKNCNNLFKDYEEKVKNSTIMGGQNDLVDYNIKNLNNSVKWFYNNIMDLIKDIKEKFKGYKFDTAKNLNSLRANTLK